MFDHILMENGKATFHGNVAQRLGQVDFNTNALRTWIGKDGRSYMNVNGKATPVTNASTLRKDEWKQYDEAVIQIARERLMGVADLQSRGLTYNIGNGLGTTVLEYEDISDFTDANVSMDATTRGEKDRPQYGINYLPLPIFHKDFSINARQLASSRRTGNALDTTMAEMAARKVIEKMETVLFTGLSSYTYGGGTIYGYLDYSDTNSVTLGAHWDDSAATGETILVDVLAMKTALIADKFFGPYVLYVPTGFETALDEDFKAGSDKSVRQRLLEVSSISDIKVADHLTTDTVVLVQMTSDVIRMVNGLNIQTVEWSTEGGMMHHFKVMAIMVPQVRSDQDGNCGVCKGTK